MPIADLVNQLRSQTIRYWGSRAKVHCVNPDHVDLNPSATIFVAENRYHCWVCNQGGGPVELVCWVRGIGVQEAVEWLEGMFSLLAFPLGSDEPKAIPVEVIRHWVESDTERLILRELHRARLRCSLLVWSVWSDFLWQVWDERQELGIGPMEWKRLARYTIRHFLSS